MGSVRKVPQLQSVQQVKVTAVRLVICIRKIQKIDKKYLQLNFGQGSSRWLDTAQSSSS
ncbi:MAG: hypothetical protein QNJ32_03340 [Xenococcaceae cyanobacterium MO_167.B27]|nr:hypothetical protein [Xenococcaceae cyanobacterium MO_167.B27]